MESVTPEWFWFWFGVLVILDLVVDIIARALTASSFGVWTCRDHHNSIILKQQSILSRFEFAFC